MKQVKSAVKSIKNAIKKNLPESKLGRALLIGATIYLGGAALGAWKAPGVLSRVNGVLAKGGASTGGAAATSASANTVGAAAAPALGPVAVPAVATPTAGQALTASIMPEAVGGTAANTIAAASLPSGGGVTLGNVAASELTRQVGQKGIISKMMEGAVNTAGNVATWANKYPLPAAMVAQGVAGALTPDQIEIEREKQRLAVEEDERKRRERNDALRMDGIVPGYNPTYQPLKFISTGQPVFNSGVLKSARGVA